MKILYGVQGTGNGHVTRARALAQYFSDFSIEADFLFSGRDRDKYFDMEIFGTGWQCRRGLTFVHDAGKLSVTKTLQNASIRTLNKDINALDLSPYDAVITDFEPISAWAAKRQGKPCIGVGHQYAFEHAVPKAGDSFITRAIMSNFAPASISLGLHWHHFNAPILPPIAETHSVAPSLVEADKILVYFGFENLDVVTQMLEKFPQFTFVMYGPFKEYESVGNIQFKPLSREGFKQDLATSSGVISNAGFELASEAIQLGKKLLVKPLVGQMEQQSNAKALEALGLGMCMNTLDSDILATWLTEFSPKAIRYPNVAKSIVQWISAGNWHDKKALIEELWLNTEFSEQAENLQQASPLSELAA